MKYSTKHIRYIVQQKVNGVGWEQITRNFNRKFKTSQVLSAIKTKYQKTDISTIKLEPHKHEDFTNAALGDLIKNKKLKKGRFFITAASPTTHLDMNRRDIAKLERGEYIEGSNLDVPAFKSIQNYCKRNNAELIILPMRAHVRALHSQPQHFDPLLKKYLKNFATEFTFNEHLKALDMQLNPQQANPLTGMQSVHGKKSSYWKKYKTSILFAHSKQDMEVLATGNDTHPRLIHSTGCITKPAYLNNRIGRLAKDTHIIGGLIVDIDGPIFHLTQIRICSPDGSFCNLDTRYFPDGKVQKERAELLRTGDLHIGQESTYSLAATAEMIKVFKPKRITFDDMFDGTSISHHIEGRHFTKAQIRTGSKGKHFQTLEGELKYCKSVFDKIVSDIPKDCEMIIVASNHHNHLTQYLNEGRYLKDPVNYEFAHRCIVQMFDGVMPFQSYLDPNLKCTWLTDNDDYFVQGVNVAVHGHVGLNGSRGSKQQFHKIYQNAMTAHSHSPGIFKDIFTVGHLSMKRHGYNNGPTTWLACNGVIYKYGQKQLRLIVDGSWKV
jgi:hypothetical protein